MKLVTAILLSIYAGYFAYPQANPPQDVQQDPKVVWLLAKYRNIQEAEPEIKPRRTP